MRVTIADLARKWNNNGLWFLPKMLLNIQWSNAHQIGTTESWDGFFIRPHVSQFYDNNNRMSDFCRCYGMPPTMQKAIGGTYDAATGKYAIDDHFAMKLGFRYGVAEMAGFLNIEFENFRGAASTQESPLLVSVNAFDAAADRDEDKDRQPGEHRDARVNADLIVSNIAHVDRIIGGERGVVGTFAADAAQTPAAMLAVASPLTENRDFSMRR